LAILAFSLQALSWFLPGSSITAILSGVVSMITGFPPIKTVMDVLNLGIVILLLVIFFVALFTLIIIALDWFIVNIVRKYNQHKDKNRNNIEGEIKLIAHAIWENKGRTDGHANEDWREAEIIWEQRHSQTRERSRR
jgi:membrane-bound ClpP family serine protease